MLDIVVLVSALASHVLAVGLREVGVAPIVSAGAALGVAVIAARKWPKPRIVISLESVPLATALMAVLVFMAAVDVASKPFTPLVAEAFLNATQANISGILATPSKLYEALALAFALVAALGWVTLSLLNWVFFRAMGEPIGLLVAFKVDGFAYIFALPVVLAAAAIGFVGGDPYIVLTVFAAYNAFYMAGLLSCYAGITKLQGWRLVVASLLPVLLVRLLSLV